MPAITGNVLVTLGELASVLGLTESRISALKRRGVIQAARPRKNEFHLGPAVRGYLQYKCGCASESEADYHREKALKERANRQLREILMEQTGDQLHDAQAVQFLVQDGNSQIRSPALGVRRPASVTIGRQESCRNQSVD